MTVRYRHESGAVRTFAGRQRRLDNDDTWERIDAAEAAEAPAEAAESDDTGEGEGAEGGNADGFPKHKGGGNYELSDGTTVKGQDAAGAAQAELDAAGD